MSDNTKRRRRKCAIQKNKTVVNTETGSRYVGDLKHGKLHGQNAYLFTQNASFFCNFVNGEITDEAAWVDFDGGYYQGSLVNGKKHGYGVLVTEDFTYTGHFQDDKFHGFGLVRTNGKLIKGMFENGRKIS